MKKRSSSKLTLLIIIIGALIIFSTVGTISFNQFNIFQQRPTEVKGQVSAKNLNTTIISDSYSYYVSTSGYILVDGMPDKLIFALEGQKEKEIDLTKASVSNEQGLKKITPKDVKFVYHLQKGTYKVDVIAVYGNKRVTLPANDFYVDDEYTPQSGYNFKTGASIGGMAKESEWTKPL